MLEHLFRVATPIALLGFVLVLLYLLSTVGRAVRARRRIWLLIVVAGLAMSLAGFGILMAANTLTRPGVFYFINNTGFAMFVLGFLIAMGGFAAYALRRPSQQELTTIRPGDFMEQKIWATWHFRPRGLVIAIIIVEAYAALVYWAESYLPGINQRSSGSPTSTIAGIVLTLVLVGLLSIPRFRNLIFYTGESPEATAARRANNDPSSPVQGTGDKDAPADVSHE